MHVLPSHLVWSLLFLSSDFMVLLYNVNVLGCLLHTALSYYNEVT